MLVQEEVKSPVNSPVHTLQVPVPWGEGIWAPLPLQGALVVSPTPGGHFPINYPPAQGGVRGKGCQLILRWLLLLF